MSQDTILCVVIADQDGGVEYHFFEQENTHIVVLDGQLFITQYNDKTLAVFAAGCWLHVQAIPKPGYAQVVP